MERQLIGLLIALAIIIPLIVLGRELFCWYCKINELLSVLKEIRDLLAAQQQKSKKPTEQSHDQTKRAAQTATSTAMSNEDKELERQALSTPNPDRD